MVPQVSKLAGCSDNQKVWIIKAQSFLYRALFQNAHHIYLIEQSLIQFGLPNQWPNNLGTTVFGSYSSD